jgi:hypothetical protein
MTNTLLIYIASVIFIISIILDQAIYKTTGFFLTFVLLTVAISQDLTNIFLTIIAGLAVHVLLMLCTKEYIKFKK